MIMTLLEEKSAESIESFLVIKASIIMICWLFMTISVFIDFCSGVSTAKALGEKLMSKGFRRTISKAVDYMLILFFALMFDALGLCFIHFYVLPFATLLCTVAIMCIEGKSVIENARRKKAHSAEIPEMVKKILQATKKEHAHEIIDLIKTEYETNPV